MEITAERWKRYRWWQVCGTDVRVGNSQNILRISPIRNLIFHVIRGCSEDSNSIDFIDESECQWVFYPKDTYIESQSLKAYRIFWYTPFSWKIWNNIKILFLSIIQFSLNFTSSKQRLMGFNPLYFKRIAIHISTWQFKCKAICYFIYNMKVK